VNRRIVDEEAVCAFAVLAEALAVICGHQDKRLAQFPALLDCSQDA
jgi:hypothetical protein